MGGVRVKSNRIPAIVAALPREMQDSVSGAADDLANDIEPNLRHRTGWTIRTDTVRERRGFHAVVGVGYRSGAAFYVRYWEFGTHNPNLFGILIPAEHPVGRAAHAFEPAFPQHVAEGVRRAVRRG